VARQRRYSQFEDPPLLEVPPVTIRYTLFLYDPTTDSASTNTYSAEELRRFLDKNKRKVVLEDAVNYSKISIFKVLVGLGFRNIKGRSNGLKGDERILREIRPEVTYFDGRKRKEDDEDPEDPVIYRGYGDIRNFLYAFYSQGSNRPSTLLGDESRRKSLGLPSPEPQTSTSSGQKFEPTSDSEPEGLPSSKEDD